MKKIPSVFDTRIIQDEQLKVLAQEIAERLAEILKETPK